MKMSTRPTPNVYLWFFQVLCVLSLVLVIIWLTLTPRNPVFSITGIYIATSKTLNSTLHRNASIIFNLETYNPNKGFGIYYGENNITLYYNEVVVGTKSMPGFYQGYKETSIHEVVVNAEEEIWRGMSGGRRDLRVAVATGVRYKIFKRKTKHHWFTFEGYATVGSNGTDTTLHRRH